MLFSRCPSCLMFLLLIPDPTAAAAAAAAGVLHHSACSCFSLLDGAAIKIFSCPLSCRHPCLPCETRASARARLRKGQSTKETERGEQKTRHRHRQEYEAKRRENGGCRCLALLRPQAVPLKSATRSEVSNPFLSRESFVADSIVTSNLPLHCHACVYVSATASATRTSACLRG